MKELRVAAFVPYALETTPSQRFRLEQWAPHLRAQGIALTFFPFADEALVRLLPRRGAAAAAAKAQAIVAAYSVQRQRAAALAGFDAIVVHRTASIVGPATLERRLARHGLPLVYDFDDAVWQTHTAAANRGFGWLKFPGKTAQICALAHSVVAGNEYLAEYARRHARSVQVVATSVDTVRFAPQPHAGAVNGRRLVVGWTGSATSQVNLEAQAEVLAAAQRRHGFEVRVHSDRAPLLPGVAFDWRRWTPANEAAEVAQFDIGIMPLPDDQWSRGKCALKALLYMASGLPVILSPVGANREAVSDGIDGLWAASREQWLRAFDTLVGDAALRERLGRAARAHCSEKYSLEVMLDRMEMIYRQVSGKR
jgi:glycosyltransferase involved in cell wall biosynthesis